MKLFRRITALLLSAGMMGTLLTAVPMQADAAQTVSISPLSAYEINDGVFEGWGTSLCWWANRLGYSDSLAQQAADAFYGENGLRMNIARFNIGGGDDPTHTHITRTDSNMPGYTNYSGGKATYDWSKDANQRNVLMRCIKAAGDDMIVEMFSNSPPYYMTNSGCTGGSVGAWPNNLKDDCYDDFAAYLAEVCYHYQHDWGVEIQSVEAMNEPYTNFWGAKNAKQEGCHFDQGESESKIIVELQKAMQAKGMGNVIIAGTDETNIDTQISSYKALSGDAKAALGRIDTHTYSGSDRTGLKNTAISAGKNLWMSEVDGNGTAGTNAGEMASGLWLAGRITADMNGLNSSAWILWQVIDSHICAAGYNGREDRGMVNVNGGFWGTCVADHDKDTIVKTKKYYAFGQYTRYIRPGMIMLNSAGNTLAAFDKDKGQLVIVAYNTAGSASDIVFDLSGFGAVGTAAQTIRTSQTENWKDVGATAVSGDTMKASLAPNSITTFILDGCKGSLELDEPISLTSDQITGTDSWKSQGSTDYLKAFDGKTNTYFDGVGGGWVQADLGNVYDLTAIGWCPRQGYEYRMTDGMFQLSEDGVNWHTAYTVAGNPGFSMHYITRFDGGSKARYVRFAVPEGAPKNDYNKDNVYCCNIAEIAIYGHLHPSALYDKIEPAKVTGTASWKDDSAVDYSKAFDGSTATYFDGLTAGWVQAELDGYYDVQAIGYCPRKGYEARMADGIFEVSTDGETWTAIQTVTKAPAFGMTYATLEEPQYAKYVRYRVPEGAPANPWNTDTTYCCNVAEIELYGTKADPPVPEIVAGDLDSSGKADVLDVVLLQKYMVKLGTLPADVSADLSGDGIVDVFDLALLKALVLKASA